MLLPKVKTEPDLGSTNNLQEINKTKEQENCTNGVKSANPDNQIFQQINLPRKRNGAKS